MIRVLKPPGSLFINLGRVRDGGDPHLYGVPANSLIGLPWRYALRCIDLSRSRDYAEPVVA